MTIQFTPDNNLAAHEEIREKLTSSLSHGLTRFSDQITKLEVHISNENSQKFEQYDKKCSLEAIVEGSEPIVVSADANNYQVAVYSAIDKLRLLLDGLLGRLGNQ